MRFILLLPARSWLPDTAIANTMCKFNFKERNSAGSNAYFEQQLSLLLPMLDLLSKQVHADTPK